MVKQANQIKHIVRNGLVDIQYQARKIVNQADKAIVAIQRMVRQADDILARCKEMEEALDKVEAEDKEEQRKVFRAEL